MIQFSHFPLFPSGAVPSRFVVSANCVVISSLVFALTGLLVDEFFRCEQAEPLSGPQSCSISFRTGLTGFLMALCMPLSRRRQSLTLRRGSTTARVDRVGSLWINQPEPQAINCRSHRAVG
jgi:hypothetical protein